MIKISILSNKYREIDAHRKAIYEVNQLFSGVDAKKQFVKEYKLLKAEYKALYTKYSILRDLFVSILSPLEKDLQTLGFIDKFYTILKSETGAKPESEVIKPESTND